MTAINDKREPSTPKTTMFRWATVLTAIWLSVAVVVGAAAILASDRRFLSLSANEWGDYLAGIFAPAAFIWLAVAVLIQSRELAAQREDLRLARLELEQNREVLAAQVEESRRQAEFIGMQTAILKDQEEDRKYQQLVRDFQIYREKLAQCFAIFLKDGALVGNENIGPPDGGETKDPLARFEFQLDNFFDLYAALERQGAPDRAKNTQNLQRLYWALKECITRLPDFRTPTFEDVSGLKLLRLKILLDRLISADPNLGFVGDYTVEKPGIVRDWLINHPRSKSTSG